MNDGDVPRQRDGKRFIIRADEILTAFLELEAAIKIAPNCLDYLT